LISNWIGSAVWIARTGSAMGIPLSQERKVACRKGN
jgi:hypothetical protein